MGIVSRVRSWFPKRKPKQRYTDASAYRKSVEQHLRSGINAEVSQKYSGVGKATLGKMLKIHLNLHLNRVELLTAVKDVLIPAEREARFGGELNRAESIHSHITSINEKREHHRKEGNEPLRRKP